MTQQNLSIARAPNEAILRQSRYELLFAATVSLFALTLVTFGKLKIQLEKQQVKKQRRVARDTRFLEFKEEILVQRSHKSKEQFICYGGLGSASGIYLNLAAKLKNRFNGAGISAKTLEAYDDDKYKNLERSFQLAATQQISKDLENLNQDINSTMITFCGAALPALKACFEAKNPPRELIILSPYIALKNSFASYVINLASGVAKNSPEFIKESLEKFRINLPLEKVHDPKRSAKPILSSLPLGDLLDESELAKDIINNISKFDKAHPPFKITLILSKNDELVCNKATELFFSQFYYGKVEIFYLEAGGHDAPLMRKNTEDVVGCFANR